MHEKVAYTTSQFQWLIDVSKMLNSKKINNDYLKIIVFLNLKYLMLQMI